MTSLLDRLNAYKAAHGVAVKAASAPIPAPEPAPVRLLERMGLTNRAIPESLILSEHPGFGHAPVEHSRDLARVLELPRRNLDPVDPANAVKWTALLRNDNQEPCDCVAKWGFCINKLLPIQGHGLEEASKINGLLGLMAVGCGKTGLDILTAMVVPGCKTALLLIPPDLRAQFFERDYPQWARHFKVPNLAGGKWFIPGRPALHVVAYSELSGAAATVLLPRIKPDLIIADEAHKVRSKVAARTKRFLRFFVDYPDTKLCALSGTLTTRSLTDYAHLAAFSLGEGSPLPLHPPTVEEWAGALDPESGTRISSPIGALRKLCNVGEDAREGFRRRLVDTPGVVATAAGSIGTSLILRKRPVAGIPKEVQDALRSVRNTWTRPDGEELVDALTKSAVCRQLAAGLYLRWTWPRGESKEAISKWLAARKAWHCEVREKLKTAGEHLDSPLLLVRAAQRWYDGFVHIDEITQERTVFPPETRHRLTWYARSWPDWKEVRDTCKPETEPVWVSDYLLKDAIAWAQEEPGICWYDNDDVGRKLAKLGNLPFYGPGPEASSKILQEKGDRSIVASARSHAAGKNLQAWSRNLIIQPMADGGAYEQLIGRTHRQGQQADEVIVDLYLHTGEMIEAFDQAMLRAKYIQATTGNAQKLVYASRVGF